jgi:hypothetical protein
VASGAQLAITRDDEDLVFALGQDVSHGAHPIGSVQDRS